MNRIQLMWRPVVPLLFLGLVSFSIGQEKIEELERKLRASPNNESLLMDLGRLYHDLGVAGDDDAVEKGFALFDRAVTLDSTNVVARAYRGRLWTLKARDAWWPPTKLSYLRQGAEDLDEAVSMAPDNIMIRLLRGVNSLGAPSIMGRLLSALEDFIVILRHPDFPEQTKELKVMAFYYGGVAYKRADDYEAAKGLFKRAVSIFPESEFAKKARDELKDMGS